MRYVLFALLLLLAVSFAAGDLPDTRGHSGSSPFMKLATDRGELANAVVRCRAVVFIDSTFHETTVHHPFALRCDTLFVHVLSCP